MLAKNSEWAERISRVIRGKARQGWRVWLVSFREGGLVGDSRANELMPFRLAVWRKLGCLKMTRSRWQFNIVDV
jgi:hypothetical protein